MGLLRAKKDSKDKRWERYACKKMRATDLTAEAAVQPERSWPGESPSKEELELLRGGDAMRWKIQ